MIRHFVSGRTIKELEDYIAQLKESLANDLLIKNDTPFGKYADLWLETFKKNRGVATQNMYENSIKNHMVLHRDVKIKISPERGSRLKSTRTQFIREPVRSLC